MRIIATPSQTAKTTYFYVQECGLFKTGDSYFTERRNLHSFLIVYTLSGEGTLAYNGRTYSLAYGDCFFIDCMDAHLYKTAPGKRWEFLWMHFNGNNALGYYKQFIKNGSPVLKNPKAAAIKEQLEKIVALNQKRSASSEIITGNLISNTLTELLLKTFSGNASKAYMPAYLEQLLKYIDLNFRLPLCLDFLAQKYGVSKFHLSKEFKRFLGITLNEYIISVRMSCAKELLKYSDKPVSEIALETGISNVSHFIGLFKAREHATPLSYRREWQGAKLK